MKQGVNLFSNFNYENRNRRREKKMSTQEKGSLTIRFANGETETYEYARAEDTHNLAGMFKEMVTAGLFVLELNDRTVCIPMQNVQSIVITPTPKVLPLWAIRGARLVG
jgi:hypothetical protein